MTTIHLISHTHWDREWHQTFQQFRLKLVHLVDGLLDILEKDVAFRHFMLDGQTIVLDDYLQIRPEREGDLRRHIQSGRVLVGPWYILPDEFLVSPEATIRNLLEGERGARRFGEKMMVGYIPDPFGHIGQMPQILRGFGIETASLWRGVRDQSNEFWWEAPDGSRVLMGFLQQGYFNAAGALNSGLDGFVSEMRRLRDQVKAHTEGEDILAMHGIDHQEANPLTSAAVAYAAGKLDGDVLSHSTLPDYLYQVQKKMDLSKLPGVRGELRECKNSPLLPGVLSARMWIKQRNRACETLLEKWAEPFSTWAQVFTLDAQPDSSGVLRDPQGVLREAWRLLMQCHPHDSICGCSIDQVHDEMRPRFDQVEQIGEAITGQSLETLAGVIDTRPAKELDAASISSAVVVFNPSGSKRSGLVSAELKALPESGSFEIVDESGEAVPFETAGIGSGILYNMRMERSAFRSAAEMISPGSSPGGMRIVGMKVLYGAGASQAAPAEEVSIEVQISQSAEVDLEGWERTRQEVMGLVENPAVKSYHVMIQAEPTSQVRIAAKDVPGLGYRTFWVRGKAQAVPEAARLNPLAQAIMPLATRLAGSLSMQGLIQRLIPDPTTRPPHRIENEFFAVEAQADGSVEIQDKRGGQTYRGQNRFVDGGDRGDTYNTSQPENNPLASPRVKEVRTTRGAVTQTLELRMELDAPEGLTADRKGRSDKRVILPITSRISLVKGVARVDFHTEIENTARDHRLRVHFAAPFSVQEGEYDGHFEIVRRGISLPAADSSWAEQPRPEKPQRAFTAVSDGKNGLLVANQGLPEAETLAGPDGRGEIAVTLLRCVGMLSRGDFPERPGPAGPELETPGAQMPGRWGFDYAVIPYSESGKMEAIQQAYAFQTAMRGVGTALHEGSLASQGSFVRLEPPEFEPSAVKISEDGAGWLVRGYNLSGEEIAVKIGLAGSAPFACRASPGENLLEPMEPGEDGSYHLTARGHEIASVFFARRKSQD